MRRLGDLLAESAAEGVVGRAQELALLLRILDERGPRVVHLHGIGGVGKSTLLDALATRASARGAAVMRLDCRAFEPTARGFLHALGAPPSSPEGLEAAAERLAALGRRVVLALDTYEVLRLLDTWLRQVVIPALPDNVRIILAGREPPSTAWFATPGWQQLTHSLPLGPLDEREALDLLARAGVSGEPARRINRAVRGHPLALKLAAAAVLERPDLELEELAIPRTVEALTSMFLADVRDPLARRALEAASVVRRATISLLRACCPMPRRGTLASGSGSCPSWGPGGRAA